MASNAKKITCTFCSGTGKVDTFSKGKWIKRSCVVCGGKGWVYD